MVLARLERAASLNMSCAALDIDTVAAFYSAAVGNGPHTNLRMALGRHLDTWHQAAWFGVDGLQPVLEVQHGCRLEQCPPVLGGWPVI